MFVKGQLCFAEAKLIQREGNTYTPRLRSLQSLQRTRILGDTP